MDRAAALREIEALIAAETARAVPAGAMLLVQAVRDKFGPAVAGVIYYGSCLRAGTTDGVLDFYAIVDSYEAAYGRGLMALGNRVVPPNVFHLKATHAGQDLRAKVAVLSRDDLALLTSPEARQSSVWARFCQPTAIVHARDGAIRSSLIACLTQAVVTAVAAVVPLLEPRLTARQLWIGLFTRTFGAEFRTERDDRPTVIYEYDAARYDRLTRPALHAAGFGVDESDGVFSLTIDPAVRHAAARDWRGRIRRGKSLTLLRLVKAAYTFEGGVDYLIWKAERHSGQKLDISPFARAHPILCAPVVLWRYWRRGVFR